MIPMANQDWCPPATLVLFVRFRTIGSHELPATNRKEGIVRVKKLALKTLLSVFSHCSSAKAASLHANGDHFGPFRHRARHRRLRSAASVPVSFLLFGPLRNDQGEERHAPALFSPFLPPLRRFAQSQGTVPSNPFLFWCLLFACFRFLKSFHFEREASTASARCGLLLPAPIGGCGRC